MSIGTLKNFLLGSNILFVLALGGLIGWVLQDFRGFQGEESQLRLDPPPEVVVQGRTGPSKSAYSAMMSVPIGPDQLPEIVEAPTEDFQWERGFQEKWSFASAPIVSAVTSLSWAVLEDRTGNQKSVKIVPDGMTMDELKSVVQVKVDTAKMPTGGLTPGDAEKRLLDDDAGNIAMVTAIDHSGVEITNDNGQTARIEYEKVDYIAQLRESGDASLVKQLGGAGGDRVMPKQTRPIAPNEWEVGEADQLDFATNYSAYIDEIGLRPYYDPRTRKLEGLQVRSKVAAPRISRFGIRNRDVIIKVNGTTVTSAGQVNDLVQANKDATQVIVTIKRNNQIMDLKYQLGTKGATPVRQPRGGRKPVPPRRR